MTPLTGTRNSNRKVKYDASHHITKKRFILHINVRTNRFLLITHVTRAIDFSVKIAQTLPFAAILEHFSSKMHDTIAPQKKKSYLYLPWEFWVVHRIFLPNVLLQPQAPQGVPGPYRPESSGYFLETFFLPHVS